MTDYRTLATALEAKIGMPTTPEAYRARCVAESLKDRNYANTPERVKRLHAKALAEYERSRADNCAHEEGC